MRLMSLNNNERPIDVKDCCRRFIIIIFIERLRDHLSLFHSLSYTHTHTYTYTPLSISLSLSLFLTQHTHIHSSLSISLSHSFYFSRLFFFLIFRRRIKKLSNGASARSLRFSEVKLCALFLPLLPPSHSFFLFSLFSPAAKTLFNSNKRVRANEPKF